MQVSRHAAASLLFSASRPLPSPDEIRVQLERILSSTEFPVPARGCAFLRYVVEETLEGRADRIKGYSIAIEVFERNEGFTQEDPVVRIEAGRLRRALERYYLVAGQADPIRIEIPKGGYVPMFSWIGADVVEPGPGDPAAVSKAANAPAPAWDRVHWLVTSTLGLVTALLAILVGVMIYTNWTANKPMSQASSPAAPVYDPEGATLVIAPFADLGEGPEAKIYATGITEELLSVLPRFKELTVFGRETSEALPPQVAVSHVLEKLGARFLLAGGVQVFDNRVRVTARLTETDSGAILWSQTYDNDLRSRDLFAIQSDVAAKVATAVAQPFGVIYQADTANAPPDDLNAYRCTLQFYGYRAALSSQQHAVVRQCLEQTVARYPAYATAWSMLSIAYVDEDRFGFNRRAGSLERALDVARRAVELDPRNVRALQALMTALFFSQQLAESIAVGERALALNPNDTEFLGEFGTRLALGGQWQRGAALLQDALARNPGGSGYYHAILALAAYMLEDDETALAEIRQANLDQWPLFHLVAAVIYAQNGMMDEAARNGEVFTKLRPGFMPDIEAEFGKRNFQPEDRARLIAGLRQAGLLPSSDATSRTVPLAAASGNQPGE